MIVDASILFALADSDDAHHKRAVAAMKRPDPRVVPEVAVVEADYMIMQRLGIEAELAFLDSLAQGTFAVEPSTREDRLRAIEIARRYRDAAVGYADAIIVATAERLNETVIATADRRHFRMIKPAHVDAFTLVPEGIPE